MTFEEMQLKANAALEALKSSGATHIYVNTAACGRAAGAVEVFERIRKELESGQINARVIEAGCPGGCYLEPIICVAKPGRPRIYYAGVAPEIASQIISDYIVNDNPRPDLALGSEGETRVDGIRDLGELPVFTSQVRIALRNCGRIDPGNIDEYIGAGGFRGLFKSLQAAPAEVIGEISKSGLRGRGGAGFPTGEKWQACRDAAGEEKYLICNAHEGDPESYADRIILESDPHSVLEGMLIAAYASGAGRGYIYLCASSTLAVERLGTALEQMKEYGLLGDNILGLGFKFDVEIVEGASDLICGEETAMIRSMEGGRAMPRPRPPYPSASGYKGKPTCINNVETLACVPAIMQHGSEWYAGIGTEMSKGTKTLVISGKVNYPGLIEVPMGTSLRQIIYDIGGGIPGDKKFKAVLVGGPSGGYLPESGLETTIDFDELAGAGAIMGSGGIIVADSDECMVDLARHYLSFMKDESCGECVMCREGTFQMLEIMTDITQGKAKPEDMVLLSELAEGIRMGSLCALGKTAPNPVLTTLKHFRDEYDAHVKNKQCPAGVCRKQGS